MLPRNTLPTILCILACSVQVADISNRYFKYATSVKNNVLLVDTFQMPSMSLCFHLEQNMNEHLNRVHGKDWWKKIRNGSLTDPLANLTVADVFKLSTPASMILNRDRPACAMRDGHGIAMGKYPFLSRDECLERIKIKTYINKFLFCYKFKPKRNPDNKMVSNSVNFSPAYPGLMAMFYLNPDIITNYSLYTLSIHSKGSSDYFDSRQSIEDAIDFNDDQQITVHFSAIKLSRKRYPYDTNCVQLKSHMTNNEYQMDMLNNLTMKHMNLVHTRALVKKIYDYPILTPTKFENESILKTFLHLEKLVQKYDFETCELLFHTTLTSEKSGHGHRIDIPWPAHGFHLISVAMHDFIDYLIYILSSIGIWLGLSILSISSWIEGLFVKKMGKKLNDSPTPTGHDVRWFIVKDTVLRAQVQMLKHQLDTTNRNLERIRRSISRNDTILS